jgi:hypothetical protein
MPRYPRRMIQYLGVRIRRISDTARRSFKRAKESDVVLVVLFLVAGMWLWLAWPEPVRKEADRVVRLYRHLIEYGTTLLDQATKYPAIEAILSFAGHLLSFQFLGLFAWAVLTYLWITDTRASRARAREIAEYQPPKLATSERVHLFAHRVASVIILLLLIFPGSIILFADPFIILMFALLLAAIYGAIRLVGWVIAALFE